VKFLVVDDDPACCELLRDILSPYAACDLAIDGREAIDAFRLALEDGQPYDLVCLDIMMPGIDGHAALEAMRQIEQQHGIRGSDAAKVMMTTALRDSKHCIRAFEQGCESYVTKPLQPQRVLAEVTALLGELHERSQVVAGSRPAGNAAAQPAAASPALRCLIVDDDGVCRALLQAMLSPYARCTLAYDGQEAIDAVRLSLEDGQPYDLITLDIMMPGLSGHDVLKAARALEAEHGICGSDGCKIIMTTALYDSKHCIQSFREGCEAYVTKPVKEENLLQKMQELGLLAKNRAGSAAT